MKPLFPALRAAEEFDSALEGRASTAVAERYADLLDVRDLLAQVPEVALRPEFAADLRSRLVLAAETQLAPAPPVVRRAPGRTTPTSARRRLAPAVAALVMVGGTAGMAAAASGSLPGESLYPIKRGSEQIGTALRLGDAAKGTALLGNAGTRLDEVSALLRSGADRGALVASTVDAFRAEAAGGSQRLFRAYQDGGDPARVATVRDFTTAQMTQIAALAPGADPATASALRDAADLLADIDQQARTLCGNCGGARGAVLPPAQLSAAAAATVDSLIARPVSRASLDAKAAERARDAGLQGLSRAAQQAAGELGATVDPTDPTNPVGSQLLPGRSGGGPLTRGGRGSGSAGLPSVPALGAPTAVRGLVSGVTTTLGGSAVGEAVRGTVRGVTDPAKKLTDGAKDTVDGVTGDLIPKPKP